MRCKHQLYRLQVARKSRDEQTNVFKFQGAFVGERRGRIRWHEKSSLKLLYLRYIANAYENISILCVYSTSPLPPPRLFDGRNYISLSDKREEEINLPRASACSMYDGGEESPEYDF